MCSTPKEKLLLLLLAKCCPEFVMDLAGLGTGWWAGEEGAPLHRKIIFFFRLERGEKDTSDHSQPETLYVKSLPPCYVFYG